MCAVFPHSGEMTVINLWRYKLTRRAELRKGLRGPALHKCGSLTVQLAASYALQAYVLSFSTSGMALSLDS